VSSVSQPNESDRISVDPNIEQPGRDTEGTVDRLNEAKVCENCGEVIEDTPYCFYSYECVCEECMPALYYGY